MNDRTKLFFLHARLVREGKFRVARRLLRLLNSGSASLGLDDCDDELFDRLDRMGLKWFLNRRTGSAILKVGRRVGFIMFRDDVCNLISK